MYKEQCPCGRIKPSHMKSVQLTQIYHEGWGGKQVNKSKQTTDKEAGKISNDALTQDKSEAFKQTKEQAFK